MARVIAGIYEIEQKIGAGGGGVVYLGRHLRLNKLIVLKADKRKLSTDPSKLRREVDLLKDLTQTYIPQVYDFVEEDGVVYTVMDYIEGESLDKMLKRGEVPSQKDVIRWACELLEALVYLHGRPPHGILHGDIKPANIMLRPDGTICLIDYNIALALGEDGAVSVGFSKGYASPESYGLVYMSAKRAAAYAERTGMTGATTGPILETDISAVPEAPTGSPKAETTVLMPENPDDAGYRENSKTQMMPEGGTLSMPEPGSQTATRRIVRLDVRSDIYSLGATLYHLLTGRRPVMMMPGNIVQPLTGNDCSIAVAAIINKAMAPSAEDRYQSAQEMLDAFRTLRKNDPRTRRLKKERVIACASVAAVFLAGGAFTFTGMKQLQQRQEALTLSEYSANALSEGNVVMAVQDAMNALPEGGIFDSDPTAAAQYALTNALGVYDLTDHYRDSGVITLPSELFHITKSPDGTRIAVVYAYEVSVYDLGTREKLVSLPTVKSALADAIFADDETLIYASSDGISAYDLKEGKTLWTGEEATGITVSANGEVAAAVNRDDTKAAVYDVKSGKKTATVDFAGMHQKVAGNDTYEDPDDDIFSLNYDGSLLAVSFDGGALTLFAVNDPENNIILYENGENDYTHFEGGFTGKYFSYIAYNREQNSGSEYGTIDTEALEAVAGYTSNNTLHLYADESGTYLVEGGLLTKIDFGSESEQELANVQNSTIRAFDTAGDYVLTASEDGRYEMYQNTILQNSVTQDEPVDFAVLSDQFALTASKSSPKLRCETFQNHKDKEVLSYNPSISHDEARISKDGKTAMLFDIHEFVILSMQDGSKIAEESLPDPDTIYDQQFRKTDDRSYLEVFWYDGTVRQYDAATGEMIQETKEEAKDKSLDEEFDVGEYRFINILHEAPEVLKADSGTHVTDLEADGALTYVSQLGDNFVTEYISDDFHRYGYLLNGNFEKLAYLPNLCDITEEGFVFDDGMGSLRYQKYLDLEGVKALGNDVLQAAAEE